MPTVTKAVAIKEFFSVPGKPITNAEMLDMPRNDRAGYDELAQLAAKALGYELEKWR